MRTHGKRWGERARVGDMVAVGSKGVGHREGGGGLGVWGKSVVHWGLSGDSRNCHPSTGAKGTHHTEGWGEGGCQGREGRATKVRGQSSQEKAGARSNVGRIQDDTTTPQNHNHNAAPNRRRQGRGSNEELKENKNKVKINSCEHYESDYRRA